MNATVVLLSDDLIFSSRITGAAKDHGATVHVSRGIDAAIDRAKKEPPRCVIVDLAVAGERLGDLLAALSELAVRPRIVAYGAHVDAAGLRNAADLGCDIVLPRSKFVELLSTEFGDWIELK